MIKAEIETIEMQGTVVGGTRGTGSRAGTGMDGGRKIGQVAIDVTNAEMPPRSGSGVR